MSKPKLTPQTPGEPLTEDAMQPEAEAEHIDQPTTTETNMSKPKLTPQTPGEPLTEDAMQPEAEAEHIDQPTTTETAAAAEEAPAVVESAQAAAELPDADTIDLTKIERPVLSKQGWVMPAPKAA